MNDLMIREIVTEIDKVYWRLERGLGRKNTKNESSRRKRFTLIPLSKGKTFYFYTGKYDGVVNNVYMSQL